MKRCLSKYLGLSVILGCLALAGNADAAPGCGGNIVPCPAFSDSLEQRLGEAPCISAPEECLLAVAKSERFVLYDQYDHSTVETYTLRPGWTGFGKVSFNADPSGANLLTWMSGFYNKLGAKAYVDSAFVLQYPLPYAQLPFVQNEKVWAEHMQKNLLPRAHVETMDLKSLKVVDSQDGELCQFAKAQEQLGKQCGLPTRASAKEVLGEFAFAKNAQPWKAKFRIPLVISETQFVGGQTATTVVIAATISHLYPAKQEKNCLADSMAIVKTRKVEPAWEQTVARLRTAVSQNNLSEIQKRAQIVNETARDIDDMRSDSYQQKQRSDDRLSQKRSDATRGVNTVPDPWHPGRTIEADNKAAHVWVNSAGQQINTGNANYNPNSDPQRNSSQWKQVR